jgi:hypothetical protein
MPVLKRGRRIGAPLRLARQAKVYGSGSSEQRRPEADPLSLFAKARSVEEGVLTIPAGRSVRVFPLHEALDRDLFGASRHVLPAAVLRASVNLVAFSQRQPAVFGAMITSWLTLFSRNTVVDELVS